MLFKSSVVAALAASASAATLGARTTTITRNGLEVRVDAEPKKCLCKSDVDQLIENYKTVLGNPWKDEYAAFFADSFYDHSESINSIAGIPPKTTTFPTKEALIQHEKTQPDLLPLVVEHVGPFNCNELSFIWSATFSVNAAIPQQYVRGLTIITAVKEDGKWKFAAWNPEFDSIAYNKALGGTTTPPVIPSTN